MPNVGCYLVKSVLVRRDGYRYDPTCLESQSTEESIRTFQTRRSSPASSSATAAEPSPVDYNSQTLTGSWLHINSAVQLHRPVHYSKQMHAYSDQKTAPKDSAVTVKFSFSRRITLLKIKIKYF